MVALLAAPAAVPAAAAGPWTVRGLVAMLITGGVTMVVVAVVVILLLRAVMMIVSSPGLAPRRPR